ncbi:MAG: type 4a pilus biogenesis protein PilO [Phycisphaeraceae bacterium]
MMNFNISQDGAERKRRTVDAVGVALCLALTGLLYVVGVHPILEQRREQQEIRRQVVAERAEVAEMTSSLADVRHQYAAVQRAVADHALRLEKLPALNRRVAELTAMARDAGLEVDGVRPGGASVSEHYRTVPVQVTGWGSFYAIGRFLRRLHTSLPDVGVWSLQLDRRGDGPDIQPGFQLELIWYAAPPAE